MKLLERMISHGMARLDFAHDLAEGLPGGMCMVVAPDNAWAVPGTTRQPPPEAGRPDVMSGAPRDGEPILVRSETPSSYCLLSAFLHFP